MFIAKSTFEALHANLESRKGEIEDLKASEALLRLNLLTAARTIIDQEIEIAELREQLVDVIDLDGQLLDANRVIDVQFKTIERLVSE